MAFGFGLGLPHGAGAGGSSVPTPLVELGNFDAAPSTQYLKNQQASTAVDDNIFGQSSYELVAIGFNNGSFTVTRGFATGPEGVANSAARMVGVTGAARTAFLGNNTGAKTYPAGTYTLAADVIANNANTQTVRFGCANSGTGTYGVNAAVTNAGWTTITSTVTKGAVAAIQPVANCAAGDPNADFLIDNIRIYPGASAPAYATERALYAGHMVPDMRVANNLVFTSGCVDNSGDKKPGVVKLAGYPAKTTFTSGTLMGAINVTQNNTNPAKILGSVGVVNGVWDIAIRNGRAYATPALDLNAPDDGTWISGNGTHILSVTFDATHANFYLDGALIRIATGSYGPFTQNQFGFLGDAMPDSGNTSQYAINPVLGLCGNARIYTQFMSDADMIASVNSMKAALTADTSNPPVGQNFWIAEGDSLTVGFGTAPDSYWDTYMAAHNIKWIGVNVAAIGNDISHLNTRLPDTLRRVRTAVGCGNQAIVSVWVGANSLPTITQLTDYYDAIRAAGGKVIAFTLTPSNKSTLPGGPDQYNTDRLALNTQIRAASSHYDALADLGADAGIGARDVTTPDVAPNIYCQDYVHLNIAGYTIVSGIVNPLLAAMAI